MNDNTQQQSASSRTNLYNDQISKSNFGSTIQSWLRDTLSPREKPWSKSARPWALDKLQRDIDRFNRLSEFRNSIETSKKMLKNGVLDYHNHADHIAGTLVICAQCYAKSNDYTRAIQYASEALQYNKTDVDALMCRGRAFENENLYV